jgi:hypothetical protein
MISKNTAFKIGVLSDAVSLSMKQVMAFPKEAKHDRFWEHTYGLLENLQREISRGFLEREEKHE